MKIRIAFCLVALATLLAAPCAARPVAEPAPHPAAQAEIERVVATIVAANKGGPREQIPEMAGELQRLLDGGRESLLQQLALYMAGRAGNEQAMGAALLIDYYDFTQDEKIAALAPYLDTKDQKLLEALWNVLGTITPKKGEVDELSRDGSWWVRSYVARVMCRQPDLGSTEIADRLQIDPDERVRKATRCRD